MNNNKNDKVMNIGLTSLLLVFLVLCLTTFALLSLSSSQSDLSLSEKLATHRSSYYQANNLAQHQLDDIDLLLDQTYQSNSSTYMTSISEVLTSNGYTVQDNIISYTQPMEDGQYLQVQVQLLDPSQSSTYYQIVTWQVRNETE